MSTVVPVAVVSSSIESLSIRISGKPRPPLLGVAAGVFHDTVIGDPGPHFAVGKADLEQHGPGGESTVSVFDTIWCTPR